MADIVWKQKPGSLFVVAITFFVVAGVFYRELLDLINIWNNKEEYSHGFLIPFISVFLIWQKSDELRNAELQGSWAGFVVILVGCALLLMGRVGAVYDLGYYGLVITIVGIALSVIGWNGIRIIWAPLFILVFMVPLPQFLYNDLSLKLQLISSQFGVAVIRLFDISVYLEGNVIDLGNYKLQVVEACSGLRYLFPLISLAFIAAYFYKVELWKRVVVFLSSIPITILMNSFRIGVIGVLVEYWGIEQAEGFLHYFEGWVIFMACMAIIILEMWVLARIGSDKRPLHEVFGLEFPAPVAGDEDVAYRTIPKAIIPGVVLLLATGAGATTLEKRDPFIPDRVSFAEFPLSFNNWTGQSQNIESIYLDELKLDDYLLADYQNGVGDQLNLYMAYYMAQEAGSAAHSPRSCIPGGGWKISEIKEIELPGTNAYGQKLKVNRTVIQKGEYKQLVYYWFQQRGRDITDEIMVRWYILVDSLSKHRTDGALVRLTTTVLPGEDISMADKRLASFTADILPHINRYIPN